MSSKVMIAALVAFVHVSLTLSQDARLEAELACLDQAPTQQCDLKVTFPDPIGTLDCNKLVPTDQGNVINSEPTIKAPNLDSSVPQVLLYMFDPDAPIDKNNPKLGYVHWIAIASVNENKELSITGTIEEYTRANPPAANPPHRYQIFIFRYTKSASDVVGVLANRKGVLCDFVKENSLGQPLAAFQFQFEN